MCFDIAHPPSPPRGRHAALALVAALLALTTPAGAAPPVDRPVMDFHTETPYPVLIAPDMSARTIDAPRPEPRVITLRQPFGAPIASPPRMVEMRSAPKPAFRMPWQIGVFQ